VINIRHFVACCTLFSDVKITMITLVTLLKCFLGLWVWLLLLLLEVRLVLAKYGVEYSQSALQVLVNNIYRQRAIAAGVM
jgi:hypothetical protein